MYTSVLAGYGILWLIAGVFTLHKNLPSQHLMMVIGTLLLTCSAWPECAALLTFQSSRKLEMRLERMLRAVVIIQAVSIATAAVILELLRLTEYMPVATVMIAGLHLLPMAQKLCRMDRVICALLLVWPLGCLIVSSRAHTAATVELGAGCVMLLGVLLCQLRPFMADAVPDR